MTSNVNKSKRCSFDLFFVENERESGLYTMNSHQCSLVLLNIIAASSCFGLETIEFSRVLFLSCMSNQASTVRSIYLPPLKYRNFSIFMIEICKKTTYMSYICFREHNTYQPTSGPQFLQRRHIWSQHKDIQILSYLSDTIMTTTALFVVMICFTKKKKQQKNKNRHDKN